MPAIDPDLSVANGASVQGGIITGEGIEQILVDVTSHTLSLEAMSYDSLRCVPIIPRNTSIPTTRSRVFYTGVDGQRQAMIRVYQGESEDPSENRVVGVKNLLLAFSPQGTEVEVEYSYDLNGVVHIVAEQKGYSRKVELKIDSRNPQAFNEDSMTEGAGQRARPVLDFVAGRLGEDDDSLEPDGRMVGLFRGRAGKSKGRRGGAAAPAGEAAAKRGGILEFAEHRPPGQVVNYVVRQVQAVIGKLPPHTEAKKKLEELLAAYTHALESLDASESDIDAREDEIMNFLDDPDVTRHLK
jgi:hypothetical protein